MLKKQLDEVNEILTCLIAQTKEDIEKIKLANHDGLKENLENKNKLINEFVFSKKKLDETLIALSKNSNKDLSELLDDEDKAKLEILRQNLRTLHKVNKEYAKFVLIMKDFFDGLLGKIFQNKENFNDKKAEPEALFNINA